MKYNVIKIRKHVYLFHISEGTTSRSKPPEISTECDLILDFSQINTVNKSSVNAYQAFSEFARDLCQNKQRQVDILFKLPFNRQFELTNSMALRQALNTARENGVVFTQMPVLDVFFASATGKRNTKGSRAYDKNHLGKIRKIAEDLITSQIVTLYVEPEYTLDIELPESTDLDIIVGQAVTSDGIDEVSLEVILRPPVVSFLRPLAKPTRSCGLSMHKQYLINLQDLILDVASTDERQLLFSTREVYRLIRTGYLDFNTILKPRLCDDVITAEKFAQDYVALEPSELEHYESVAARARKELPAQINEVLTLSLASFQDYNPVKAAQCGKSL